VFDILLTRVPAQQFDGIWSFNQTLGVAGITQITYGGYQSYAETGSIGGVDGFLGVIEATSDAVANITYATVSSATPSLNPGDVIAGNFTYPPAGGWVLDAQSPPIHLWTTGQTPPTELEGVWLAYVGNVAPAGCTQLVQFQGAVYRTFTAGCTAAQGGGAILGVAEVSTSPKTITIHPGVSTQLPAHGVYSYPYTLDTSVEPNVFTVIVGTNSIVYRKLTAAPSGAIVSVDLNSVMSAFDAVGFQTALQATTGLSSHSVSIQNVSGTGTTTTVQILLVDDYSNGASAYNAAKTINSSSSIGTYSVMAVTVVDTPADPCATGAKTCAAAGLTPMLSLVATMMWLVMRGN